MRVVQAPHMRLEAEAEVMRPVISAHSCQSRVNRAETDFYQYLQTKSFGSPLQHFSPFHVFKSLCKTFSFGDLSLSLFSINFAFNNQFKDHSYDYCGEPSQPGALRIGERLKWRRKSQNERL